MNDDDIRDLLDRAAPARPDLDPGARSAAVAVRGRVVRRRNRLALAATAVAVVAAGVTVPLTTSGDRTDVGPVSVATDVPTAVVDVPPCPVDPITAPGTTIDPGATVASVRLCPASTGEHDSIAPLTGLPRAALTTGVATFLADLRALPSYTPEPTCALGSLAVAPWAMVFAAPDGTTTTVGSDVQVCSSVTLDGTERGVRDVLRLFAHAVEAQPVASCPERSGPRTEPDTFTGALADFVPVSIAACAGGPDDAYRYAARPLAPEDVAPLWRDLRDHTGGGSPGTPICLDLGRTTLVLLGVDGSRISARTPDCGPTHEWRGGTWAPSRTSVDAITEALGGRVGR